MSAYTEMNKAQLRDACRTAKIKNYGSMSCAEMRYALKALDEADLVRLAAAEAQAEADTARLIDTEAAKLASVQEVRAVVADALSTFEGVEVFAKGEAVALLNVLHDTVENLGNSVAEMTAICMDAEVLETAPAEADTQEVAPAEIGKTFAVLFGAGVPSTGNAVSIQQKAVPHAERSARNSGYHIEKNPVHHNGIRSKAPGTIGAALWALFYRFHAENPVSGGTALTVSKAKGLALANGLNTTSASISFYRWKKFNDFV